MERDEGHLDASRGDEEDAVWALSHDTVLIAAFSGWNDAGGAATGATEHIAEVFGCDVVADIDPDEFVDFQVNRPVVDGVGVDRRLVWPGTQISMAYSWNSQRRIVVAHGVEPSFRWRSFTAELLTVAESFGVKTIIVVGALLGDTPHSRPIPVQVSTSDAGVQDFLGTGDSEYEGPTGIVGVISQIAPDAGFTVLSVWGAVPHYVPSSPSPKATAALVSKIEELLGEPITRYDLDDEAKAWEDGVSELAESDPQIAQYVRELEEVRDATQLPNASGEAIAREFEQYLRRRGQSPAD